MLTHILNDKIGNLLLYLAVNTRSLSVTKALKLLYIIDETSMREIGVPVTWSGYKVWQYGPVSEGIYEALNTPDFCTLNFNKFIEITQVNRNGILTKYINSVAQFDDSDFTDYEIDLINRIISKYGAKSATQLVGILHKDGSLWSQQVANNQLNFDLQGGRSDVTVPLTDLLKDSPEKQEVYSSAYESLIFQIDSNNY